MGGSIKRELVLEVIEVITTHFLLNGSVQQLFGSNKLLF